MRKSILSFILLAVMTASFAQTKPKQKSVEKPPTQKEMKDMMKEMQKALNEISPKDKRMMDSMGVKMPDMKTMQKNVSGISDAQLKKAYEDEGRIVPQKDAAGIANIPNAVSDANMGAYIKSVQNKIALMQKPEDRNMSDKINSYLISNSKNSSEAANMATALWIAGNPQMALYNLGNICIAMPENTDNLSNYAAMLSMMGGQHLAIPILNNLNNKFPQNSTLLNNLGQAWFGLGDITKAEKYLDSAILLYAYHPQANMTKALIEESKGNITKAIEAIKKSIYHAYSSEKEEKLRKLGYKLILQDLRIPFKPGSDPLGLQKFKRPDYPKNLSELKALKPMWTNFNMECDDRITKLTNDLKEATGKYTQFVTQSATKNVQSLIKGFALPLHIKKASLKMSALRDYHATKIKVMAEKWISRNNDLIKLQRDHRKPPAEAPCETQREAENNFINKYNEQKKAIDEEVLQTFRLYANDLAYWSQFTSTDKTQFEIIILEFQIDWLKRLKQYQPLLNSEYEELDCLEDEVIANPTKLAEFDKVACNYNDTMDLQVITFYQNCSRMTSKLNLKFLEYTRYDNFDRPEGERFTGSTIKLSAERGFKNLKLDKGPLKLEAKVGASVELEFDQKGVKDINLAVEAKVGAGHTVLDEGLEEVGPIAGKDLIDNTVEIGVEGRISIVSGHGTISGSGLLKDVKLK